MEKVIPIEAKKFQGLKLDKTPYQITEYIGRGRISFVFKAVNDVGQIVACKIIPNEKLRDDWKKEIQKVQLLEDAGIEGIVRYIDHGAQHLGASEIFTWILWRYVPGMNLKEYILEKPEQLQMSFIENLCNRLL